MSQITTADVVDPKSLSTAERRQLTEELYGVHTQIFAGVERDAFARYVVDSPAGHTAILRHRNEAGEVVGYLAFHAFERRLNGRETLVLRAEAGLLREYRGGNANTSFGLRYALRHLLRHPGWPAYYLGSLVHPSSYALFARYTPALWPRADAQTPPELLAFMHELANDFGLTRVDPANPLVRHVGWRTIESEVERDYWMRSDKPAARFFVEANPGFPDGHGLVTLVPITARTVADILRATARRRARTPAAVACAVAEASPFGARAMRTRTLAQLRGSELLGQASEATLEQLADRAQVLRVPGGRLVFARGDVSDELYLLGSGAVYVMVGDEIVDELSTGAVFGELAMLAGEPRSATVRTATTSVLVRIPRDVLLSLMEDDGDLNAGVWRTFGAHRFDDMVRGESRHAELGRRARLAWYEKGEHETLAAGDTAVLSPGAPAFVVSGALELEHQGLAAVVRGSLLLEPPAPLLVRAREPVRLVRLGPTPILK
ncbi:MAG TPA: cyclic nucleotide-binding domain-containing protein [Solirubrobacter sp.]|nr:cyclic nucleotide-binding domain-containing protein [Solirubrobacter sp.]